MYKTIKVSGRLLNSLSHLIIAVQIKHIRNQIECILIVLNFRIQARKIEAISQVLFIDLAEVFVSSGGYELEIFD